MDLHVLASVGNVRELSVQKRKAQLTHHEPQAKRTVAYSHKPLSAADVLVILVRPAVLQNLEKFLPAYLVK